MNSGAENIYAAENDELCRKALAGYKRPKAVHFIDAAAMPRSETGKILREELEVLARHC
jgi:fatty-acyl-CoA synthase